jgi:hypothetical protein
MLLALAGVKRLGLADRITAARCLRDAAGGSQGAIGVDIHRDDACARRYLAAIDDAATAERVTAERAGAGGARRLLLHTRRRTRRAFRRNGSPPRNDPAAGQREDFRQAARRGERRGGARPRCREERRRAEPGFFDADGLGDVGVKTW